MNPVKPIKKCAILADPRDAQKEQQIAEALEVLIPALQAEGIAVETFVKVNPRTLTPPPETDVFIVLGGDGTMIHFGGLLSSYSLPFYGLNYGNVGFMMNSIKQGIARHAQKLARGDYETWSFPLLTVKARNLEGELHEGLGLNDIYLQRMTPQSCRVNITINDRDLKINPILCDGLIVATPLGSTAYNFNITGSMVAIDTPALTLTPIAAHRSCPVSSMMLPLDTRIKFEILEPAKRRVQVVSDGESQGDLVEAEVAVSPHQVMLCFDREEAQHLPMRFINKACS